MKKTFLLIALLAGSLSFSQAQQQPRQQRTPEETAQRSVDMLEKRLSLTADQKAKIYTIELAQAKTRDSVWAAARNADGDRQAMMSKMKEVQEGNDKQITALLNDEQKKSYQQWVEERRNRTRGGQGGQRPAQNP